MQSECTCAAVARVKMSRQCAATAAVQRASFRQFSPMRVDMSLRVRAKPAYARIWVSRFMRRAQSRATRRVKFMSLPHACLYDLLATCPDATIYCQSDPRPFDSAGPRTHHVHCRLITRPHSRVFGLSMPSPDAFKPRVGVIRPAAADAQWAGVCRGGE